MEHLLRDIRDVAVGTLSTRLTNQLQSLQGLHLRLRDIGAYLQRVIDGELPVNHAILSKLQDVFNLLPNLTTLKGSADSSKPAGSELAHAMSVKTNDQLMTIYLSSLIRAITAYHDLIDNKIQNLQQQEEKEAKKEELANGSKDEKKDGAAKAANGDGKESSDKDKEASEKKK